METNCLTPGSARGRREPNGWRALGIALISLAVGWFVTAKLMGPKEVSATLASSTCSCPVAPATSDRVFELRVYHVVPGKVLELESQFRDTTSKLLAKHDLKVVGYWVPEGTPAWENTFVYIIAHASREEGKKNWAAMRSDPELQEILKAEQGNKLVEKVDVTYMRPTDFSAMK